MIATCWKNANQWSNRDPRLKAHKIVRSIQCLVSSIQDPVVYLVELYQRRLPFPPPSGYLNAEIKCKDDRVSGELRHPLLSSWKFKQPGTLPAVDVPDRDPSAPKQHPPPWFELLAVVGIMPHIHVNPRGNAMNVTSVPYLVQDPGAPWSGP